LRTSPKAKADANAKLKRFLPPSLVLEFDFAPISTKREQISIQLRDGHEGHSPLGVRGTGIGRLIGLMAALLSASLDDQHYMILVDEPENSLHADAQHTLRSVLEELASKPNIQVVYATHSPSMINPIRTGSIRLLSRANNGRVAHTVVNNRPIDENFLSIRSSLGITPADSLLYAPVTLVVEGPSEVLGLPVIIGRLWKDGVEGFKDAGPLLSHVHFLDGQGDSYEQLCKLALSQGAKPIVFLDGDKSPRVAKTKKRFPDVPVILLDGNSEFEEIVPKEHYFNSLQTVMNDVFEESAGHLTVEHFDSWELSNKPHPKKAFSKRVEDWVLATTGFEFVKPLVMKHALSTVPLDEVNLKPLKELMFQIRNQL
jgi:AAA ATPase domain